MVKEFTLFMHQVQNIGGGCIHFDLFGNITLAKPIYDSYPVVVRDGASYYVHKVCSVHPNENYIQKCFLGKCSIMDAALYYYNVFMFEYSGMEGIEQKALKIVSDGVRNYGKDGNRNAIVALMELFSKVLENVEFHVLIPEHIAEMSVKRHSEMPVEDNGNAIDMLSDAIAFSGIRSSEISRRTGIKPCNLSLMLNRKRNPSVSQYMRVVNAIGFEMKIVQKQL